MLTEQELLTQLNESQREAVTYCDGPQLVIAGAGSGKTRVLTYKIAWLLAHYDIKPWNLLALTFTNKAAKEMKSRIGQLVGDERARYLQMGTFHSIFARILRAEAQSIGYTSDFTIYDEQDSRSLIKNIVKTMGLDDKTYKPVAVHSAISMAKNRLCLPTQYADDGDLLMRDRQRNIPETFKIYATYQQRLRQANAMDFDDLLTLTHQMLKGNPTLRKKYAERFQYVLVDEYQDTNFVQQQIVTLLTKDNGRVCVVGDDYQSIYAFRGAKIDNILNFKTIYQGAKIFKLERNYRSTQMIVSAANSLMKHNERQIPKDVYSKNEEGNKITVWETISDKREAAIVCQEIKRIKAEERCAWRDFAILYRTNAQSRLFEEEMRKPEVGMGNHYRIYGGLSFYQRKEVKDLLAYFRLVVNPSDEEAFRRIINYPTRGIGDTTLQKIVAAAQKNGVSLWEVICHPEPNGLSVNKGTLGKLFHFQSLINEFIEKNKTMDALSLGNEIVERSGIKADLATDPTAEGDSRRQNLDALLSGMAEFVASQQEDDHADQVGLADYLSTVSLMTDMDNDDNSEDKLTMMTVHAAKGLEFQTVFVVGMEENIFPSVMSTGNLKELEEERRLLYVAITRAKKRCYLTWAHTRWQYGKMNSFVNPSRFLEDIDTKFTASRTEGGRLTGDFQDSARPLWNDDSKSNLFGRHSYGRSTTCYQRNVGMQNSHPVANQFMADPMPKLTSPRRPERAVNPFSQSFQEKLKQTGSWNRVSKAMANGVKAHAGATTPENIAMPHHANLDSLKEGQVIEHQRFGRGVIVNVEGNGENTKATVDFETTGRKQLLLKFARFTIVG